MIVVSGILGYGGLAVVAYVIGILLWILVPSPHDNHHYVAPAKAIPMPPPLTVDQRLQDAMVAIDDELQEELTRLVR